MEEFETTELQETFLKKKTEKAKALPKIKTIKKQPYWSLGRFNSKVTLAWPSSITNRADTRKMGPGVVAYACDLSIWEVETEG